MFKSLLIKVLSRNNPAVKKGAKDAQKGKPGLAAGVFAQRGRDAKQKSKK